MPTCHDTYACAAHPLAETVQQLQHTGAYHSHQLEPATTELLLAWWSLVSTTWQLASYPE
jgi:hypothetical protein